MTEFVNMPSDALRELLMRSSQAVSTTNERYEGLIEDMRHQAEVFRDTMLDVGAATDIATSIRLVKEGGLFRAPEYADDEHRVWCLTRNVYGGGSLDQEDRYNRGLDRRRCLVIHHSGKLALISWSRQYANLYGRAMINLQDDQLHGSEFVNRKVADTVQGVANVRKQFVGHLEAAAARYTRRPFEPYKLR